MGPYILLLEHSMLTEEREKIEQKFKGKKHVFPGQLENEKVIFFARKHPLSFAGMALIALLMLLLPIAGIFIYGISKIPSTGFAAQIIIAIIGAYILFALGFFLVAWISFYYDVIIVTNHRVIEINQEALFFRKISEANLADVEDVNAEIKGILPTFFHYGTVFIQTAGTAENFEFQFLPKPYKIAKLVSDLHQQSIEELEHEEAEEIGKSIARRRREEEASQKDIEIAAQKQTPHGKNHSEIYPQGETPKRQGDETLNYQESTGWKEMDNYQPVKENKPQPPPPKPKEEPKPEPKKEDDNSINHDDLKKGGEADF